MVKICYAIPLIPSFFTKQKHAIESGVRERRRKMVTIIDDKTHDELSRIANSRFPMFKLVSIKIGGLIASLRKTLRK